MHIDIMLVYIVNVNVFFNILIEVMEFCGICRLSDKKAGNFALITGKKGFFLMVPNLEFT